MNLLKQLRISFENGKTYDEVLESATDIVARGFENQPSFDISEFSNYDVMKEKLAMGMITFSSSEYRGAEIT